jgi:Cysteine-rich secretory protein family
VTCTPRRLLRLAAPVLLLGLATPVVGQAMSSAASATTVPATATTTVQATAEGQLLSLTNSARTKAGLPALVSSSTLVSLARGWSAHMAAAHALSHNPSLPSKVSGWYSIGENVGEGGSASQVQSLFMASSDHRANILDKLYNRVGIGIVRASDGTLWITVDFEQTAGYKPPAPTAAVHKTTPTRPAVHPKAAPTAAQRLAAARQAAVDRANRSLVRGAVPAAHQPVATPLTQLTAAAAADRAERLIGQEQLQAEPATAELAFTPALPADPGSSGALVALGAVATLLVSASVVTQLRLRRGAGRAGRAG